MVMEISAALWAHVAWEGLHVVYEKVYTNMAGNNKTQMVFSHLTALQ